MDAAVLPPKTVSAETGSEWLRIPVRNRSARIRLVCFPYAGGAASAFRAWVNDLGPHIELCSVQLPGRESRLHEQPLTDLKELVALLAEELARLEDLPYVFYGHSMGTLIAFELCRRLRKLERLQPRQLIVSGRCAPQVPDCDAPLHELPDDQFIAGLRRYNGTPETVLNNPELMELFIPLLRADFCLSETYEYLHDEPLGCAISAFAGQQERCRTMIDDWRVQTNGAFHSAIFPGDHFFLNEHRSMFVSALRMQIERQLV